VSRGRGKPRPYALLVASGLVAAVVVPYLALGGGSYSPTPVADPCQPRDRPEPEGLAETIELIALSAVDNVACKLDVSREDLVLALRSEDAFEMFSDENGIERGEAEQAIRDGLVEAVDEAEAAGVLNGLVASLVRQAAESVPPWLVLEALERLGSFLPG
jgi:hypothetical protein